MGGERSSYYIVQWSILTNLYYTISVLYRYLCLMVTEFKVTTTNKR